MRFWVRDYQTIFEQQVLNVYRYDTAEGGDANSLGGLFLTEVLEIVATIQGAQVGHYRLEVLNLDDEEDWYEVLIDVPGTESGDALPPFVAFNFKLERTSRATRPGAKRFAGVLESWVTGGVYNGANQAQVTAVEDALAATLTGGGVDYFPVIQQYVKDLDGVYVPSNVSNPINGASLTAITSQNSRKFGRGS